MTANIRSYLTTPSPIGNQLFLTDLPHADMGNFTCVPGSHAQRFPWDPQNTYRSQLESGPLGCAIPADVRYQARVAAGDIVLFCHALWHGVSANRSTTDRVSVIVSYAKTFVRPYDYERTPAPVLEWGTPRQRLLFGALGGWAWRPGCYYHLPPDYLETLLPRQSPST